MTPIKKILCLFDYGPDCHTGYATASRNIVANLKQHFGNRLELDICATNYFGEPYTEYDGTVTVVSAKNGQDQLPITDELKNGDDFGLVFFCDLLQRKDYSSIFYLGDLGVIAPIVPLLHMIREAKFQKDKIGFSSVIYFPVDGTLAPRVKNEKHDKSKIDTIPPQYRELFMQGDILQVDCLYFFDVCITYTSFGKKEVLRIRPDFRDRIYVISHGTNTTDFFPLPGEDVKKFRDRYFGWNANKFIVGAINRNQPRKDIPTAIFGFVEAKKNWDKNLPAPFLYLHMHPKDPKGWDLRQLLNSTGLQENKDYMFPKSDDANLQVDSGTLNKIYNSIDVYLSTARGGGWELTVTEAMSVKTPCIIPEHTSMEEIGMDGHNAFMLTEFLPVCDTTDNTKRWMCHYDEISDMLLEVAADKYLSNAKQIGEKTTNAYEWITGLDWKKVCKEWIVLFEFL